MPFYRQQSGERETLSPPCHDLEDWMKRSDCLLQVIRYRKDIKKTSAVCYKSLKSSLEKFREKILFVV